MRFVRRCDPRRILRFARRLTADSWFILGNYSSARRLAAFPYIYCDRNGITYRGMQKQDVEQTAMLLRSLNHGEGFSWKKRVLFRLLAGEKLMLVATKNEKNRERVVGMDMFYFNSRDITECTVHEGFIGVHPDMQGLGIATRMRKIALEHFERSHLKGVSTRISLDNKASLISAENLGFEPIERYHDPASDSDRYYMIRRFV